MALVPLALAGELPLETHTATQVAVAAFPEGVQYYAEAELRLPFWAANPSPLLADAYVSLGAHAEITPSFPRGGPVLRVAPVAFWDVTFRAYGTWYMGTFSSILPVEDGGYAPSREDRQARIEAGERTSGTGLRLDAETRLKGRAGPVIVVAELGWRRWDVTDPDGELAYFWEPSEMLTIGAESVTWQRNGFVFLEVAPPRFEGDRLLWLGALGNWPTCPETGDSIARLGPIVRWKPGWRRGLPTLYAGAQAWVESRSMPVFPPFTFLAANWSR